MKLRNYLAGFFAALFAFSVHAETAKVTIEDAEIANQTFEILMGDEVAPRKKFIQSNAKEVENLDI